MEMRKYRDEIMWRENIEMREGEHYTVCICPLKHGVFIHKYITAQTNAIIGIKHEGMGLVY